MDRSSSSGSGCWFRRSILEKCLIVSLCLSSVCLVTLALILANEMVRQSSSENRDRISGQDGLKGRSAPFVSTGEVDSSLESKNLEILKNSTQRPIFANPTNEKPAKKVSRNKDNYFQQKSQQQTVRENKILPISDEENEGEDSKEEGGSKLGESLRKKIEIAERKFAERYPRDHAGSALRQLGQFLPRPLSTVRDVDYSTLSDDDKISEIVFSLDIDGNGSANAWELHDWMLWVEKRVHQHVVEDQWTSLGLEGNHSIGWSEYHHQVHPYGLRDAKAKRRFSRERRRWRHADKDDDNRLTKSEFKRFLFPHLSGDDDAGASEVIVHEAHEALDADYDGRVSQSEFISVHRSGNVGGSNPSESEPDFDRPEAVYFRSHLDGDRSGFLDVEEIAKWVEPTGFVQAKSEVVYLMQHLDTDNDKQISKEEAMAKPELFLKSQVTFFGQIYQLKNLRSEVFHIQSSKV